MFSFKKIENFFVFYLPILLWMGFIFYLSSLPNLKTGVASVSMEFILRKVAHLLEYAFLAFLFGRLFDNMYHSSKRKIFLLSLLGVLLFSLSDEFHQIFVEGRFGNVIDVGIDLLGGFLGLIFFLNIKNQLNLK
ncbi:MAG: VanZ family protein [Patescibacteria group bacterium]|jgi:VanZ family protein|nr:VanZ family protein [Patescibacteria group bacterium]